MTPREERFMKVVELGGEKEAAQALEISQPSVAHSLRDIEAEHGVVLFSPHVKPLELTREGLLIYNSLKQIQQIEIRRDEDLKKLKDGYISIGVSYPADCSIAFKVLDDYLSDYRISKVDFKECSRLDFCKSILDGDLDFAISPYEVSVNGLVLVATIINTEWGLVIPSGMPLAKKERVSGKDLVNMPFILHSDPYFNSLIENHLKTALRRTEASYDSSSTLLTIMHNGFGMGFITSNEKKTFESNGMTFIPLYPQLKSTFYVYSRDYSSLQYYAQKLYDKIYKTTIDYKSFLY